MAKKTVQAASATPKRKRALKNGLLSASAADLVIPEFTPTPHLSDEQAQLAHSRFTLTYTLVDKGMQFFAKARKPEDYHQAYRNMNVMLYADQTIGPRLMKAFGFTNPAKVGAAGEVAAEDAGDGFAIDSASVFFHNAALMAKTTLDPDDAYADLKDATGPGELLRQFSTLLRCTENMRSLASGRQLFLDEKEPSLKDYLKQAKAAQNKAGELLRPVVKP
jgi:hypothetical protein